MEILCSDLVLLICKFIGTEKDVIQVLSTCKYLHGYKNKIIFNKYLPIEKAYRLSYYDSFTTLELSNIVQKKYMDQRNHYIIHLPKNIKKLTVTNYEGPLDFIQNSGLTHLYLLRNCKVDLKNLKFPNTLQYLTWNIRYNKSYLEKNMPIGLKELSIDNMRCGSLVIPNSISTLIINEHCNIGHIELPKFLNILILYTKRIEKITFPEKINEIRINVDDNFLNFPDNFNTLVIDKYNGNSVFKNLPYHLGYTNNKFTINIETLVLKRKTFFNTLPKLKKILVDKEVLEERVNTYGNYFSIKYNDYLQDTFPDVEIIPI